jgi:hypothetical protein
MSEPAADLWAPPRTGDAAPREPARDEPLSGPRPAPKPLLTILAEAAALCSRDYATFFLAVAVVVLPAQVVQLLVLPVVLPSAARAEALPGGVAGWLWAVLAPQIIVRTLARAFALAAVVFVVDAVRRDGRGSALEAWSCVLERAGPLVLTALAAGLATDALLLCCFVPGLVGLLAWSLCAPAVVLEGRGLKAALGRSAALFAEDAPRMLRLAVLLEVPLVGVTRALEVVVPRALFLERMLLDTLSTAAVLPFVLAAWALLYEDIRRSGFGEPGLRGAVEDRRARDP